MTDRIEKIVSKWGFDPLTLASREQVEVQYVRNYRGFKFCLTIFTEDFSPYTKVHLDCMTRGEDSKTASMRFEIGKFDYFKSNDTLIEFMLKDKIKQFLDEFLAYDLFHDKEWEDGK